MFNRTSALLVCMSAASFAISVPAAFGQAKGKVGQYSDVVVQGSILEPEKLEVKDYQELAKLVKAPDGFSVEIFARDLVNPRMLAVSENGTLYATRRDVRDVPTTPALVNPEGVRQGANSMGSTGYIGPKPPIGDPAHDYHFQIFALDIESLDLEPAAKRDAVLEAMKGHVLAEGEVVGKFAREAAAK